MSLYLIQVFDSGHPTVVLIDYFGSKLHLMELISIILCSAHEVFVSGSERYIGMTLVE